MEILESISSDGNFNFDDGSWVGIDDTEKGWEFQADADDEDTYCSGNFYIDDEAPKLIIDYDGAFELPLQVIIALEHMGYNCNDIK